MQPNSATLYLLCGKIASGKSTLAKRLAEARGTIIISEDDWLAALFSDQMMTVSDYVRCSKKLKRILRPHIVSLLKANVSVVLDFPANTLASRTWMREIFLTANADHELHYLEAPDEVCKARLKSRNEEGDHAFAATEEQFIQVTKHFVEPTSDEGFNIIQHRFGDE